MTFRKLALKSSPLVKKQIEKDEQQKDSLMNDLDSKLVELLKYKEYFLSLKEEMEQQQTNYEDEKHVLQKQIDRFKKMVEQLKRDKEEAENFADQSNSQLEKIKSTITKYNTILRKVKSDLNNAKVQVQEYKDMNDFKEKKMEKVNQEKNQLKEEIENLNHQSRQKDQQNKKLRNLINQLKSENLDTQQDLKEMIALLDQSNSGRPINRTNYRTSSTVLLDNDSPSTRLKSQLIFLVQNLGKLKKQNQNLTNQLNNQKRNFQQVQDQKNELEKKLPIKSEQAKNCQSVSHLLARAIVPLQQEKESLEFQNEFLKKRSRDYDNLKNQVDQLQQQLSGSSPTRKKSEKFQEIVKAVIENQKIQPLKKILTPSNYNCYTIENTTNVVKLIPKKEIRSTIPRNLLLKVTSYSSIPNNINNQFSEYDDEEVDDDEDEEEYRDVERFTEIITHFYPEYFTESTNLNFSNEFLEKEEQVFGEFSSQQFGEGSLHKNDPQIDLMKKIGQTMKGKINNYQTENEELKNNNRQLGELNHKLQSELNLFQRKNQELEDDNLEKNTILNQTNSTIQRLKIKIQTLEEEQNLLVPPKQLEELERQLQNAKRLLSNNTRKLKETQSMLSDYELENDTLKDDLAQRDKEKQTNKRKLDLQINENKNLLLEIQKLKDELESSRNDLEQAQSSSDKFKKMLNQMKKRDHAMKTRVSILDRQINAYKKHMDILKEEISSTLEKEVDNKNKQDQTNLDF
ncbi:structural maintenance of chromosomes protein [Anaeramoeba flamelloides]|uniref:Structural maintenance of chromosomes protein n=1 Tax=Anaeramoeba flamelloides TaxID=1746091 RepID=A0ABQ8XH22_9EUKA|nr:structural maintenance of chromosomes protein [Anaeramoeba flamelloides]